MQHKYTEENLRKGEYCLKKKTETQEPSSSEEYLKAIERLKTKSERNRIFHSVVMLGICVLAIIGGIVKYNKAKAESFITINDEHIQASVDTLPHGDQEVKVEPAYTKDGINYSFVTIGKYKTLWTETDVNEFIGNNNIVDTDIYVLTLKNKEKYFGKLFNNNKLVIVRYSLKGEQPFTEEEVSAYKSLSTYYFTADKAKNLSQNNAEYEIAVNNIDLNSNRSIEMIVNELKEKLETDVSGQTL